MKPKLIFSDVDNTLVLSLRGFTDKMVEAFKYCDQNDIEFILCSGRPTPNLIDEARALNQKGANLQYVAGFNAAEIYDVKNDTYLYQHNLSGDDVKLITQTLVDNDFDYLFYDDRTILCSDVNNEWIIHEQQITKLDGLKLADKFVSSAKVLGICEPGDGERALAILPSLLPDFTITLSTEFFIEITKKGVDKGFGLVSASERLSINQTDVMCMGDGGNDYAMFETDAYKVAVQNATEAIKNKADIIIGDVSDDAAADYILNDFNVKGELWRS